MILHSKITPEHPQITPEQHHAFGTFLQPKRSYSLVDLAYYKQKKQQTKDPSLFGTCVLKTGI